MKSEVRTIFLLGIALALSSTQPLWAQLESPCEDHCQINTNLAGIVNAPLNPTAALVTPGWGGVAGVGYNFNKRHAIIGEFRWNRVYPEVNSLQLLRTVLENSNLNAFTDFYVLTGNYRFELRGQFFGTYLIGGGGLYVRNTHLSQSVTVLGFGTPCTQTWLWWGFSCADKYDASQTLATPRQARWAETQRRRHVSRRRRAPRIYTEARCHYAPTGISTHNS